VTAGSGPRGLSINFGVRRRAEGAMRQLLGVFVIAGMVGILVNFTHASADDNTEARVKALENQVA
jgi:hypothetical protein